ncbi:unnamed protein product [Symbiodinium microadriaticum]|nr:unnamed protein product [Symbiodinium microadriaticum]
MLAVATTAMAQQSALISTSCQLGAGTFEELCQPLPNWSSRVTVASFLLYYWGCLGFYAQFVEVFLADQLCPLLCQRGSSWLCQSEYRLGLLVFLVFALVSWPPQLSGTAAVFINNMNFLVKWVVIVTAVAKGVYTVISVDAERDYVAWAPSGFVRVACLLMSSYANTGIMPQIAADVDKSQQQRAAKLCPIIAVSLQLLVYFAVAYSAYFALGDAVTPGVFATYNKLYPGYMTTILQGGMALLTFFSSPLLIIPLKAQIYGLLSPRSDGEGADLSQAPSSLQVVEKFARVQLSDSFWLTLSLAFTGAIAPCIVGPEVLSPSYKGGKSLATFLCCWLFFLGGLGLIDAGFQILESLAKDSGVARVPLATNCAEWGNASVVMVN